MPSNLDETRATHFINSFPELVDMNSWNCIPLVPPTTRWKCVMPHAMHSIITTTLIFLHRNIFSNFYSPSSRDEIGLLIKPANVLQEVYAYSPNVYNRECGFPLLTKIFGVNFRP